jgi:hypothetical protein
MNRGAKVAYLQPFKELLAYFNVYVFFSGGATML